MDSSDPTIGDALHGDSVSAIRLPSLAATTCQDLPMAIGGSDDTLSRRMLLVQGVVATSAVVLAACGSSSSSSDPGSTSPKSGTLDDTTFDLLVDPNRTLLVSGTAAGRSAAATGSLHGSGTTTITGLLAGLGVLAHLTQQDQVPTGSGYLTTTNLEASVGGAGSSLTGLFTLDGDYALRSGAISGGTQGRGVHVRVDPAPGALSGTSVTINGAFGVTPLALTAGVPTGGPFSVVGTVDGRKVRFDVSHGPMTTGENFPMLRVTGNYSGPTDLFALIIGGIAYFGS